MTKQCQSGHEVDGSLAAIRCLAESTFQRSERSQAAWTELHGRYRDDLLRHARLRLQSLPAEYRDPEDVVDQAWFRVVRHWRHFEYRGRGSLRSWLRLQVRRVVSDLQRQWERRVVSAGAAVRLNGLGDLDPEDPAPPPQTHLLHQEMAHRVHAALQRLPSPYRRVLRLAILEGRARRDVAERLGLKPNTVTQQILRGLDRLRAVLRATDESAA